MSIQSKNKKENITFGVFQVIFIGVLVYYSVIMFKQFSDTLCKQLSDTVDSVKQKYVTTVFSDTW